MLGTTSRRGGGSKQRPAAAVEDDVAQNHADDSPRFISGSAKAEAVGRGAGSTVSRHLRMALLVLVILVGTVLAVKLAWEEVRFCFVLFCF